MEETEVAINSYLEQLDLGTMDIEIPDIEEKIEELEDEIRDIKSKNPYLYKYILTDEKSVQEKKDSLTAELM